MRGITQRGEVHRASIVFVAPHAHTQVATLRADVASLESELESHRSKAREAAQVGAQTH
jgi:hypothetical protein